MVTVVLLVLGLYASQAGGPAVAGPAGPPPASVTFAAIGDVMLSRAVPRYVNQRGSRWLWAGLPPEWWAADLRFCNLECPVTTEGPQAKKAYSFRGNPDLVRRVLSTGRVNAVSIANNHTFDCGRVGLEWTLRWMDRFGLPAAGAGWGRAEAVRPRILVKHGLRIGLLAYTSWDMDGREGPTAPTQAVINAATLPVEVAAAKRQCDVLLVSCHWGEEYMRSPTSTQQRLAFLAIDAGADAVLGHHPHVRQPVAVYHGKPIAWSLGNGVFDRPGGRFSDGLFVLLRLGPGRAELVKQVPLRIEIPRPVAGG